MPPQKFRFIKEFPSLFEKVLLGTLLLFFLIITFTFSFTNFHYQEFVYLADSFLHGSASFREIPSSLIDVVIFNHKLYWHLGPVPAILLMPFVLVWGADFMQGYLQFFLIILDFYLLYALALKLGVKKKTNALWLALVYLFGTGMSEIVLNSNSWRFAQIVLATFLLLSLYEFFGKKRFWLMGIFMACAIGTRLHIILALSFFLVAIIFQKEHWRKKTTNALQLLSPVIIVLLLLSLYNFARFGNVFDSGYALSIQTNVLTGLRASWGVALEYSNGSLFSLKFLFTNIYFYFFRGLAPVFYSDAGYILTSPFFTKDPYGISILITSPIFLFTFMTDIKEKAVYQSWIAAILIFLPLLVWFAPCQRLFFDSSPFLFIILARAFSPNFKFSIKLLMFICIIMNLSFQYVQKIGY